MTERPLTNKQQAFCREYVKDSNGSQAAIRAGYSTAGAKVRGSELLTLRNVTQEISRIQAGYREKHVKDRQQRKEFWSQTMDTAPNMCDRLRASELLGKSECDFIDVGLTAIAEVPVPLTAEQDEIIRAMAQAAIKLKLSRGA